MATLDVINEHINNLYRHLTLKSDPPDPLLSLRGIADRSRSLTQREANTCSLIIRRLDTAEIATCLFISRRTVEKHIENIFEKLDVGSREQLRWRLGVTPPMGIRQPQ